ncbi:hypothetical protein [Novosphingobium sp. TCA1]|uniref:hypothetical protein n=1 Tax=Novosphingobium sp. TCA1 TaxID=2682474 RepID=UPI0013081B17|nr:hypothetical protein [Novosphingobium sp. TCA1]GFE72384.1 hypothetical protein NTCA1_00330 [Novosphingobium sp. TCA1]
MRFVRKLVSLFRGDSSEIDAETKQRVDYASKIVGDVLNPQLEMLKLEYGVVPNTGSIVSARSRGYLLGLVARVMGELPEDFAISHAQHLGAAAFSLVYGQERGIPLFVQSVNEHKAGDPEIAAGSNRGVVDASYLVEGASMSPMNFYLLNSSV